MIDTIHLGSGWAGGLYYARNIAFELLQNAYIRDHCRIYICCTPENRKAFEDISDRIRLISCPWKGETAKYLFRMAVCCFRKIDYLYWGYEKPRIPWTGNIAWIADFQHNRLPGNFSEEETAERNGLFRKVAESAAPLVLSSEDSLHDFEEYYSRGREKTYVVPFVSYIEPMIRQIRGREEEILRKLSISGIRYACVMNQFWQHKNHKVIFEALKILYTQNPDMDLDVVMTGRMEDYRNPEYTETLKAYAEDPVIRKHLHLLGFIDREDQIAVMKNAEFVIQPSLFEGWGTVAEDAKVLDKTILLSDIPIHREQKNEKCRLFDPKNAEALAELIREESGKEHRDDPEAGIRDMYRRAEIYSKGFENLLRDAEKGRTHE